MPDIIVNPFVMRDSLITIGLDSYQKAVIKAELVPSSGVTQHYGLHPDAVWTFPNATTFTFDIDYSQDWGSDVSLSRMLWDASVSGILLPVVYVPNNVASGGLTSWAFDVYATSGAIGGTVNAVAVASVSLGVSGRPVPTYTAPVVRRLDDDVVAVDALVE